MADLRDLANALRITAKTVETGAIDAVKEVYTKVGTTLVYATPIDTSRARANFQGTVGSPTAEVLFQPPAAPPSPRAGTDMALQSIRDAASSYTGRKRVYSSLTISIISMI